MGRATRSTSRPADLRGWLGPAEVAIATGVSTDTLRHYERRGVIAPPARTPAGYRRYRVDVVARVRLVQRALTIGFSLESLARVLAERDRGAAPCRGVRALLEARLGALDAQLRDLRALRRDLVLLADAWDRRLSATPPGGQARLLETLEGRPAIEDARERRGQSARNRRLPPCAPDSTLKRRTQRGQTVRVPRADET